MRIAMLNRGRETYPGGDVIALDATMEALRRRGHEVVETGWDLDKIKAGEFDLCHIFHCNFSWSWGNYEAVRTSLLPYVLTPIYYPGLLAGISTAQMNELLSQAKYILPFSRTEQAEILRDWPITGNSKFEAIPNGTDLSFHAEGLDGRDGVLCVVARAGDKNVDIVGGICEQLGISFKCVLGVAHKDLPAIYRKYKVFVNASGSERMSLTIGEALCSGCRVIATTENRGNEHYEGLVRFTPLGDGYRDILKGLIRGAVLMPDTEWDWRPNYAARKLTWDRVAEDLESVYRSVR